MRRTLLLVAAALVAGGCASRAWTRTSVPFVPDDEEFPASPAHRAVERVTLRHSGREFEFVGYRACDPGNGEVRETLVLESGVSVLDVAAHGEADERISGGAFDAVPRFAETVLADLRRMWGSRSAFDVRRTWGSRSVFDLCSPKTGIRVMPLHGPYLTAGMPAVAMDGGWLAIAWSRYRPEPLVATFLDVDLIPTWRVEYRDFDDNHVPREIHLVDLVDGHEVDVEVEEVRLTPGK